jgi:alcohol dehydrogenase (cytochrome c)
LAGLGHPQLDGLLGNIEMRRGQEIAFVCVGLILPLIVLGQGLDPALLTTPSTDSWPTYSGDYTARRHSGLKQINDLNVKHLALAWTMHLTAGMGRGGTGGFGPGAGAASAATTIVGGIADEGVEAPGASSGSPNIKGSILQMGGVLYVSSPDNAWAVDARDGSILWHYFWKSRGGTHIGNRGMAMYHDWLFFETPDDELVSLDAKTGKERWHKDIADFNQQYFSTSAPVVIGDHLIVGTGDDLAAPGFLQSVDPETGDLQWKWWSEPLKMGDPGSETWPNEDAMRHGAGEPWIPGSYDPQLKLYYIGTGNPEPGRGETRKGDNLFTCTIVALNVDTGKMVWYFQATPHDIYDWDSAQTPVLIDGEFNGKPRKMLAQANRNGYYFLLDRVTGEHLVTAPITKGVNWSQGAKPNGSPLWNPDKTPQVGGAFVAPASNGATNWMVPTFDPESGLFIFVTNDSYFESYITDLDPQAQRFGGIQTQGIADLGNAITALDYKSGKVVWRDYFPSGGSIPNATGMLTTAGKLLFAGDSSGNNIIAFETATGKPLWHSHIGLVSNAPETYMLDGRQYVLVAATDALFAFALNQ